MINVSSFTGRCSQNINCSIELKLKSNSKLNANHGNGNSNSNRTWYESFDWRSAIALMICEIVRYQMCKTLSSSFISHICPLLIDLNLLQINSFAA